MSEWTPLPDLERYATLILSRNMEERARELHRSRSALVERAAAQGRSGGGYVEVEKARLERDGFQTATLKSLRELIELLEQVYEGQVPIEAYSWIEAKLNEYLDAWLQQEVHLGIEAPNEPYRDARRMTAAGLRREIELTLGPRSLAGKIKQTVVQVRDGRASSKQFDLFISYASEDRAEIVWPLYQALTGRGISCWIDRSELNVGDSLIDKISEGLKACRFGVVVFSHAFFSKKWPQEELKTMFALSEVRGAKMILPVWHKLDKDDVANYAPFFLGTLAAKSSGGVEAVADQLALATKSTPSATES